MGAYRIEEDVLSGRWFIEDDEGFQVAGPFHCEQDAYDYQESFLDD